LDVGGNPMAQLLGYKVEASLPPRNLVLWTINLRPLNSPRLLHPDSKLSPPQRQNLTMKLIASTLFLTLAAAQGDPVCGYGVYRNSLCCNFDAATGQGTNCEERECKYMPSTPTPRSRNQLLTGRLLLCSLFYSQR
jgi:hypothetical protein